MAIQNTEEEYQFSQHGILSIAMAYQPFLLGRRRFHILIFSDCGFYPGMTIGLVFGLLFGNIFGSRKDGRVRRENRIL